jgi:cell wall-associated NlpC family hydrolase
MTIETIAKVRSMSGKPYVRGALGPESYDCYSFVRDVYSSCYNIELPEHNLESKVIAKIAKSQRKNFCKCFDPRGGDLVLMGGPRMDLHVGIVIDLPHVGYVIAHMDEKTGVVADNVHTLELRGFSRINFYRPS